MIRTNTNGTAVEATKQAKVVLRHRDIVGWLKEGRTGLGATTPAWNEAILSQRQRLMMQVIRRWEEAAKF